LTLRSRGSCNALACEKQSPKQRKTSAREQDRERTTHSSAAYTKLGAFRSRSRHRRSLDEVGQLFRVLGLVLFFAGHDGCLRKTSSSEQEIPARNESSANASPFKYFSTNDTKLCPLGKTRQSSKKAWTVSACGLSLRLFLSSVGFYGLFFSARTAAYKQSHKYPIFL
jgi:hypothetical protein